MVQKTGLRTIQNKIPPAITKIQNTGLILLTTFRPNRSPALVPPFQPVL